MKGKDPGISFECSLTAASWETFLSVSDSEFKFLTRRQVPNLYLFSTKKKGHVFLFQHKNSRDSLI